MSESVFNPDTFTNIQVTGEMDTQRIPIPAHDYVAVIDDIKPRKAKDSAILDIFWLVDGGAMTPEGKTVQQVTGLPKNIARQSIFLDITPEGGLDLSKGKNIGLGQLREALGQNNPGTAWSPGMLKGGVAKITIKHRPADDGSGQFYTDVKGITKAS